MLRPALAAMTVLLPFLAGCPVMQGQNTPVRQSRQEDPSSGTRYWLYVPSNYSADRAWPVVITLHGMHGFDSASAQVREWKMLAEENGFIVAAPELRSPLGFLALSRSLRAEALEEDERRILGCLSDLERRYRVDGRAVLLTGFSSGGYPLYYTGLRHPDRFTALAARACNNDLAILESLTVTDSMRKMPVIIIRGIDDFDVIGRESMDTFRWLRQHGFTEAEHHRTEGGHIRRPELAWQYWRPHLPA